MSTEDTEKERTLLADLSQALYRQDHGIAEPMEVERARSELIEFYRALGMHP
jgi:hypothetical protein